MNYDPRTPIHEPRFKMVCRQGQEDNLLEKIRHSCAHVMADAVTQIFPSAKVTIGPCIENGFYYDFDYPNNFTPQDLEKIEEKMKEIINGDYVFDCRKISKKEAILFFEKKGEKYKVEIVQGLPEGESITFYQHGEFVDLCKGPHVEKTSQIKAFKLLNVAGSYWRGDEKREPLQRIYGTAFQSEEDLRKHLLLLEEAAKRDHRKLGKELDLFTFHPEAPASPFFHPKGALVYRLMTDYLRDLYKKYDYREVITPLILDMSLWERSGHLEHFKENMYFTEIEGREMAVKPMNCPGHCLMFGEKKWSYRELPIRMADFGRLHRFERSGVTHGLTRVRTFAQDDAHIFCTPEQMDGEIELFIQLTTGIYKHFGFDEVLVALATRPEHFIGTKEIWNESEKKLEDVLKKSGVQYHLNPGEGAFYGPKIEFQVKDALQRPWQLGTLQVDYSMPERFNLAYITQEGIAAKPVMLHRAILGSIERFYGILLEHCGGALPFWLAPVQIKLVPITNEQVLRAREIKALLEEKNFRVEVDDRNEKLGFKIREAQVMKIPYMAVIGAKEVESGTVSLRHRKEGDLGVKKIDEFVSLLEDTNKSVI